MGSNDAIVHHRSSIQAKIALFQSLFRGRDDTGKASGTQPAKLNLSDRWRAAIDRPSFCCTQAISLE